MYESLALGSFKKVGLHPEIFPQNEKLQKRRRQPQPRMKEGGVPATSYFGFLDSCPDGISMS